MRSILRSKLSRELLGVGGSVAAMMLGARDENVYFKQRSKPKLRYKKHHFGT